MTSINYQTYLTSVEQIIENSLKFYILLKLLVVHE